MLNDNLAWDCKKNRYRLNINPAFTLKVANLLSNAGYSKVYSVYDGFEGDMSKEGRRTVNGLNTLDQASAYFSM